MPRFMLFIVLLGALLFYGPFARAADLTPQAAQRAKQLKADIKTFTLHLHYEGPKKADQPFCELILSVPKIPLHAEIADRLVALITADEATKIIDYLAGEGFLDGAENINQNAHAIRNQGTHYSLAVLVENLPAEGGFTQDLGWKGEMLRRLDGLRTVLGGDAAKQMDVLLERLADQRKAWEKEAATQPAASKVVEKDGLAASVVLPKGVFTTAEPMPFTLTLKNTSDKPFQLCNADNASGHWRIRAEDLRMNGPWELHPLATDGGPRPGIKVFKSALLEPGHTVDLPGLLDTPGSPALEFVWAGEQTKPVAPLEHLRPGKYRLTVTLAVEGNPKDPTPATPYWTGRITTAPVDLEIVEKKP